MLKKDLLNDLDPDQRQVALHTIGPLCVRAGAGTGKTRAMTYRIAYGVQQGIYKPEEVLALTFTSKAAAEMSTRLQALGIRGVQAQTFHAAALGQLRHFWSYTVGGSMPELIASKSSLVAASAHRLGLQTHSAAIRDMAAEIEWTRVRLISPGDYEKVVEELKRQPPAGLQARQMASLLEEYQRTKSERNVIDFEDVLVLNLGILLDYQDVAQTVRNRYKFFVVDEYQDVSPLQHELLQAWLGPQNNNLCVVGDAAQTIYSFTGASSQYLTGFTQRYPGARVIELTKDYRSTPQVVGLANALVKSAGRLDKELKSAVTLQAMRPNGPAVKFKRYEDDTSEAEGIAKAIRKLHNDKGIPYSEIAILYRTNVQSQPFEQALSQAGISYVLRGGVKFFERQEIRQALSLIKAATIAEADTQITLSQRVSDIVASLGWTAQPPSGQGAERERWDNLQALVALAEQRTKDGFNFAAFFDELKQRQEAQAAPVLEGVTLSTLHAAKGLEWQAVFIIGASQGLLPYKQAGTAEMINEERRLAYVGVTRAKEHLMISFAAAREPGGAANRRISDFFKPHSPYAAVQKQKQVPYGKTTRMSGSASRRATREFLESADKDVGDLFERLRAWRHGVAKGTNRRAYLIFSDATLRSIAEVKPKTLRQLSLISGVGRVKLHQFGRDVLALVRGEDLEMCVTRSIQQLLEDESQ